MAFSFFRRSSSNNASPAASQSEAERLRGRQLASLMRAGGQALDHKQSLFDVPITLPDQRVLYLRITLPERFPLQGPTVATTVAVDHPWIEDTSSKVVTGHSDLRGWSAHADLGRIVMEIRAEFQRTPPRFTSTTSVSSPPPAYVAMTPSTTSTPKIPPVVPPVSNTPAIPAVFPHLDELSTDELEKLLRNKDDLKSHVRSLSSVESLLKTYDELIRKNTNLAAENNSKESVLLEAQESLASCKAEFQNARDALSEKEAAQQEVLSQFQPKILIEKVKNAVAEADEESESLAYDFTQGDLPISDFIQQYLKTRTLYHLRSSKVSRFNNSS